ncbi:MAG TPA: 2-amino-4-hydroxy-6-hydroxymethyldihydropteridine diphosphokinase [Dehalococcoidia bacterium]|nr:2-amino-4-hydroxy-6-hydroxymethyldihydropteridine diphosphokinase [Dehalococcoidia bacterium]|tara:strand:+ start:4918 stop:5412 length:495 start_codon:yes stop_codon:yes gene_type:complete
MREAILALGSNLGDRAANLQGAVDLLFAEGVRTVLTSSVWETPPMPTDQPRYLNATVTTETALVAEELLLIAKEVEYLLGRRPSKRWGARPIDIDVLFYGESTIASDTLKVPHPMLTERAFVLLPLSEVVSKPLPVLRKSASSLLTKLDTSGHTRTGLRLQPPS